MSEQTPSQIREEAWTEARKELDKMDEILAEQKAQVDRLSRALANMAPTWNGIGIERTTDCCDEPSERPIYWADDVREEDHDDNCAYLEAVEYVAALEDK